MQLISSGGTQTTTTNGSGNYSLQVSPGTYTLVISSDSNNASINLSQHYKLISSEYVLNQDTVADFTVPVKKVSVHVQDSFGSPVANVGISASIPNGLIQNLSIGSNLTAAGESSYGITAPSPTTDASGNIILWLLPTDANTTYNLTAIPPSGSGFESTILSNITFTDDTLETIILQQPVNLSGHVYDSLGNPVPNQIVKLVEPGTSNPPITATTDTSGNYALQASTGVYTLVVTADNNPNSLSVPEHYQLISSDYSLTQNTVANLTIPAKKVTVHVQGADNNPISNVEIKASIPNGLIQGLSIGNSITAAGESSYGVLNPTSAKTNSSGSAILWLLPNDSNTAYNFTATPPSGSIYSPFTLNNISVTGDQTEIISLQFIHDQPVTTVTLSPDPNAEEEYPDPVTVTLSAAAADGFSIASTKYMVDGGSQQTYTVPFTVSGDGEHTIAYSSVDNVGVFETPKQKTFTIHQNQAPVVSSLSNVTISEGDTYSASGSFTDTDSTSWTGTVDYGDGTGVQPLSLNGMNFTLSHMYQQAGEYTVTVQITDNQEAVATETATITVTNPVATLNPLADAFVERENPDHNFGDNVNAKVDDSPKDIAFIKFNTESLAGKTVINAKLRLFVTGVANPTVFLKDAAESWSETAITWNNRPNIGNTITTIPTVPLSSYAEVDITNYISNHIGERVAFALTTNNDNTFQFSTRESIPKPELVITYQ